MCSSAAGASLASSPDSLWGARSSPAGRHTLRTPGSQSGRFGPRCRQVRGGSDASLPSPAAVRPNHPNHHHPTDRTASPAPPMQSTADFIRNSCCTALSVPGDVTDPAFPARLVAAAVRAYGHIHILVCNAGFTWDGMLHKMPGKQWDAMLAVHCTAPFRLIQVTSLAACFRARQPLAPPTRAPLYLPPPPPPPRPRRHTCGRRPKRRSRRWGGRRRAASSPSPPSLGCMAGRCAPKRRSSCFPLWCLPHPGTLVIAARPHAR